MFSQRFLADPTGMVDQQSLAEWQDNGVDVHGMRISGFEYLDFIAFWKLRTKVLYAFMVGNVAVLVDDCGAEAHEVCGVEGRPNVIDGPRPDVGVPGLVVVLNVIVNSIRNRRFRSPNHFYRSVKPKLA